MEILPSKGVNEIDWIRIGFHKVIPNQLLGIHNNMTYMIIVTYLVDAKNQGVLIAGKVVDKHCIKLVGSNIIILHIVVSYRSRNHICNTVKLIIEWLYPAIRSEGTELVMMTTEHIVLVEVKYRYNDILLA